MTGRHISRGIKKRKQAYLVVCRRLLYHIYAMIKNKKLYKKRLPDTKEGEGNTSTAG
jgi:hypothetical protein